MTAFNTKEQSIEAYKELGLIIAKHINIISKSEKNRLLRMRLRLKDNPNQYNRNLEQAKLVDEDTTDNLIKMALHIVKGVDIQQLQEHNNFGEIVIYDSEAGSIEERIPLQKANKLLGEWKKILLEHERSKQNDPEVNAALGSNVNASLLPEAAVIEQLKDNLFVKTGEDLIDTFAAFDHYKL